MNSITQKPLKIEIGKASLPITHHPSSVAALRRVDASPVLRSPSFLAELRRVDSTAEGGRITQIPAPEWWALAPLDERRFLGGLARMMRSARRSKSLDVARAAVKWERALGCFIKVRLITERHKAECRMKRWS